MVLFWLNRILACVVWAIHLRRWWFTEDSETVYLYGFFSLVPVILIWLSHLLGPVDSGYGPMRSPTGGYDLIGMMLGTLVRPKIDVPSGAWVIQVFGWIVLLYPWWWAFLTTPVVLR